MPVPAKTHTGKAWPTGRSTTVGWRGSRRPSACSAFASHCRAPDLQTSAKIGRSRSGRRRCIDIDELGGVHVAVGVDVRLFEITEADVVGDDFGRGTRFHARARTLAPGRDDPQPDREHLDPSRIDEAHSATLVRPGIDSMQGPAGGCAHMSAPYGCRTSCGGTRSNSSTTNRLHGSPFTRRCAATMSRVIPSGSSTASGH